MNKQDLIRHKIAELTEMYVLKITYNPKSRFNSLKIKCPWTYEDKGVKTLEMFMSAFEIVKPKIKKKVTYKITVDDLQNIDKPLMSYSKNDDQKNVIVIPDFVFLNWKESGMLDYDEWCQKILEASKAAPEYNTLFWIGNVATHPTRETLCKIAEKDPRMEVYGMNWIKEDGSINKPTKFVSLIDHTKYKYLIDVQGRGYSGRIKMLLFSGRPMFIAERRNKEYWHNDLVPFDHYIPVKEDLSDLVEQLNWAEAHPDECARIAKNAQLYAINNLTREKAIQYFANVLLSIADEQSFEEN